MCVCDGEKEKIGQEKEREREINPWERVLIKFSPLVCVCMLACACVSRSDTVFLSSVKFG